MNCCKRLSSDHGGRSVQEELQQNVLFCIIATGAGFCPRNRHQGLKCLNSCFGERMVIHCFLFLMLMIPDAISFSELVSGRSFNDRSSSMSFSFVVIGTSSERWSTLSSNDLILFSALRLRRLCANSLKIFFSNSEI